MIFVGVLILIYFYRPTMYQVEKVSKYEWKRDISYSIKFKFIKKLLNKKYVKKVQEGNIPWRTDKYNILI
jgi:hypothetical protein